METGNFKELIVWQKSILLVKSIYTLTNSFPRDERLGLISQIRRCSVSIPSNIAEGQARRTTGDYIRLVSTAEGSLVEAETQLIIAVELGYCSGPDATNIFALMVEVRKMLNALRRSLIARANRA